jgi:DNA-binding PadR family transcriptional regulator
MNTMNMFSISQKMENILRALSNGDAYHGYEIMKTVGNETGINIPTGTLYRCINKLLEQGFIEKDGSNHEDSRTYYKITNLGIKSLENE